MNDKIELISSTDPSKVTSRTFPKLVIDAFPTLKSEIEEDRGLLHLQMATLRRFGESAAGEGNLETARNCVALVDSIFSNCDGEVRNAVYVSFVENIESVDSLYKLLTPKLMEAWEEIHQYLQEIAYWRSKNS